MAKMVRRNYDVATIPTTGSGITIGGGSVGRGGIGIFGAVYLIIGIVVAATHGYFVAWNIPGNILEGLAAIVLWPLVFFGVDLHSLIP